MLLYDKLSQVLVHREASEQRQRLLTQPQRLPPPQRLAGVRRLSWRGQRTQRAA